jgi:hypothetical protein
VRAARAIGWVFVAVIGWHALLAASDARRAGSDGRWGHALGYGAIAVATAVLVIAAGAHAAWSARRRVR